MSCVVFSRVGLPWGGLGLFVNVAYQQFLFEHGCDVFIAGESDNMGFRFAEECGIPMIETSHEVNKKRKLILLVFFILTTYRPKCCQNPEKQSYRRTYDYKLK
ncbi:MAG: hypothetical protein GXP32_04360 [Kiritimatiellaeota bacterium]|nr:hypothetical protein [Kiritimatiellota bacterium]